MKNNFDIDKIEKKTPYPLPQNFFEDMQKQVLDNIQTENYTNQKNNTYSTWYWAAALLILGSIIWVWLRPVDSTSSQDTIASTTSTIQPPMQNIEPKRAPLKTEKSVEQNLTSKPQVHQKEKQIESYTNINEHNIKTHKIAKESTDFILANIDPDEIKEVTQNIEQDLYLDLY